MPKMIPWDSPKRNHGAATSDFAKIAADVQSRGLPKPVSSGNFQITIRNPSKSSDPRTVYLGKRRRERDHQPGKPWYIEWETSGPAPRDERMKKYCFANPREVIKWLQTFGF